MRKTRLMSHKPTVGVLPRPGHIVEDHLDRRSQFLHKYQTDIHELIQRIDTKASKTINVTEHSLTERRSLQKSRSFSSRKDASQMEAAGGTLGDHQKMLLGLEYSLQAERKQRDTLQHRCASLQSEISNLRNLLVGPQKEYEKTVFKELREKVTQLQAKLLEQRRNLELVIQAKGEEMAQKENALRTATRKLQQQSGGQGGNRRVLELLQKNEELLSSITRKNILIERLLFHKEESNQIDSEDQSPAKDISKVPSKAQLYFSQLDLANKLILKKNIQILTLNKRLQRGEEVLSILEQYLDRKQVRNVDLSLLEHPCIVKVKNFLREKVVFQKELLGQLSQHSKIIAGFQQELKERTQVNQSKLAQANKENGRFSALVNSLQSSLKIAQQSVQTERRVCQCLRAQADTNKRLFVEEIMKLKSQLGTISSVTKNEFDRMKLQNLKLTEQNRSLLFLVGQKEKEIHKKGEVLRTFHQYKEKINNLPIDAPERRKIDAVSEDPASGGGSKLLLISTFSQWMMEWNKLKNWANKKMLLNVMLDKEELQRDSLGSLSYLINVLHEAFLSSKNVEIQERAIVLLSCYIPHKLLSNVNLFLDKLAPIVVRGFRQPLEGQDLDRHRILNESSLKILSSLSLLSFKWSPEMTNEMLSINGLKYLFQVVTTGQVDELVVSAYRALAYIAGENEMISFMNSFNVTTVLLTNLTPGYPFLSSGLQLLKVLLQSRDYLKTQKSLLQFRQVIILIRDCSEEQGQLVLDCLISLMQSSSFTKSVNKIETFSVLAQGLKKYPGFGVLKKVGLVYAGLLAQLQTENVPKIIPQTEKLLQIISQKRYSQARFNRAIRIILKTAQILTDSLDLDDRLTRGLFPLYDTYAQLQPRSRVRLNHTISAIFQRNPTVINRYSNQSWLSALIEAYRQCSISEQLLFLLRLLLFQQDQKRTTEILRNGREGLIGKLVTDGLLTDYQVALLAVKNLLAISKEKYSEKFVNKALFGRILGKVLPSRTEEEYLGTVISLLYFFCKNQTACATILQLGLVQRIFQVITQRHQRESLVYKCLTLLQLCHSMHYKKKILNYLLASDPSLSILKSLSFILRKAKNKQQMGTRATFLYDYLNTKTAFESLALLIEQNQWMVQQLVILRNEYINKVDPLVYKIEMLLHSMSTVNAVVRKNYEKFKVEGEYESQDDREE